MNKKYEELSKPALVKLLKERDVKYAIDNPPDRRSWLYSKEFPKGKIFVKPATGRVTPAASSTDYD